MIKMNDETTTKDFMHSMAEQINKQPKDVD